MIAQTTSSPVMREVIAISHPICLLSPSSRRLGNGFYHLHVDFFRAEPASKQLRRACHREHVTSIFEAPLYIVYAQGMRMGVGVNISIEEDGQSLSHRFLRFHTDIIDVRHLGQHHVSTALLQFSLCSFNGGDF
jgi:hypothetical protein